MKPAYKISLFAFMLLLGATAKGQSYYKKSSASHTFTLRLVMPPAVQVDLTKAANTVKQASSNIPSITGNSDAGSSPTNNELGITQVSSSTETAVASNDAQPFNLRNTATSTEPTQVITLSKA